MRAGLQNSKTIKKIARLTALAALTWTCAVQPVAAQIKPGDGGADPRRRNAGAKVTSEPLASEAKGQTADNERLNESYQAKGVDLGLFLLLPKLEVDETYTNNLFATRHNAKSDLVTSVRPELKLRSRFKEHALNLSASAEQRLHGKYTQDNRLDLVADLDGRYDFSSETQATYFAQGYATHEERGSPDDAGGRKPTPTAGMVNRLGVKHQFGRFTAVGEVGADRRTYEAVETDAGTLVPNGDRDRWELQTRGRLSYEIFPGYAAVGEVALNRRIYDRSFDRNGYQRDSSGMRVETGIGVDISQLIRGDFLVGYFAQDYEDSRFSDPKGLSFRSTFNWTPSTLTIIVPSLERSVNETTTLGSSALVRNTFSVTVRHELERNVILTGYGSASYDQAKGVQDQDAMMYEGRFKAIYAFSPELFAGAEVAHRRKQSQSDPLSYQVTTLMVRLGLQY